MAWSSIQMRSSTNAVPLGGLSGLHGTSGSPSGPLSRPLHRIGAPCFWARFTTFTGTVIEVQRFINVPMRWGERYVCRERRELWLSDSSSGQGYEEQSKWVIHTKVLPARRDHRVVLLLAGSWVLGLYNDTTGACVNFVRADPPFLTRGVDVAVILALGIASALARGWPGLLLTVPEAMAYLIGIAVIRGVNRWRLQRLVDDALNELELKAVLRPLRRIERR